MDPISVMQFKDDAYLMDFVATKQLLWRRTEKLDSFLGKAKEFDVIFYVGGFGPMFDIADNEISIKLIREFHEAGKYVVALCHGTAAVVNVKLADGSYFVAGEKVTGFSDSEEVDAKRPFDMPWHLQDALNKASGGHYEKAAQSWASHITDNPDKKLLMGQNPGSAKDLAELLLKKLSA